MTTKEKSRIGGHQATLQTTNKKDFIIIINYLKAAIVTLALWGWFPLKLADWLNQWGEGK